MGIEYILLGDPRENDFKIYCRGSLADCRNKARRLIMHWNKEYFHPKKRREISKWTDKKFCNQYWSAWFNSPSIARLPNKKSY